MAYKQYMYRKITTLLTIQSNLYKNGGNIFIVSNVTHPPPKNKSSLNSWSPIFGINLEYKINKRKCILTLLSILTVSNGVS